MKRPRLIFRASEHPSSKRLVNSLQQFAKPGGEPTRMTNPTDMVKRPWGGYLILRKKTNFWVKKLYVNEGARLSLQRHQHRNELWLVLNGKISAQVGNQTREVNEGELVFVPKNTKHRITGLSQATVLEFAFGKVLERDIERFEDDFGRAGTPCYP